MDKVVKLDIDFTAVLKSNGYRLVKYPKLERVQSGEVPMMLKYSGYYSMMLEEGKLVFYVLVNGGKITKYDDIISFLEVVRNRKYITYEKAEELFLDGYDVWYETGEYDYDGNELNTCVGVGLGDTLDDLHEDRIYFE